MRGPTEAEAIALPARAQADARQHRDSVGRIPPLQDLSAGDAPAARAAGREEAPMTDEKVDEAVELARSAKDEKRVQVLMYSKGALGLMGELADAVIELADEVKRCRKGPESGNP